MKKCISLFLVFMLVFSLMPTTFAENNRINVKIYGMQQEFDVMPINENGRVLVPMRAIFEKLGAKVEWDDATKTVIGSKIGKEVKLTIGDTTAYVDGKAVTLDVPAKIVDGRTLVPVRFISESMGAIVSWDDATKTVIVNRGQTTNIDYDDGREIEKLTASRIYEYDKIEDVNADNIRRPVPTQFEKSSAIDDLIFYPQPKDPVEVFKGLTGGETLVKTEDFFDKPIRGEEFSTYEVVDVEGMPFDKALRFTTVKVHDKNYNCAVEVKTDKQFETGDTGMLVVYTRLISGGSNDSGEGRVEVTLQETATSGYKAAIQSVISFGKDWTATYIPFQVQNSVAQKPLRMHIRPGHEVQVFEIGGYELINYGQKYTVSDMPNSAYYKGMEEDAAWRSEAMKKIEQIRKGDITITVKDKDGNVIPDALVDLDMYETEFEWGTAIGGRLITNDENGQKYRQNIVKYFNGAVFESDSKWNHYENFPELANFMVDWCLRNGMKYFRGHALIWDRKYEEGTSNTSVPPDIGKWYEAKEYDKILDRMEKHIYEEGTDFAGRMTEWDVINEMNRGDAWIVQEMGWDKVKQIFEWARKADPNGDLYFNECGVSSVDSKNFKYYLEILDWAIANGVDFDGIGVQGHQGNPKDPQVMYKIINTLGERYPDKKIKITEFDILLSGSKIDPDLQANYCRDVLIAMYSSEHLDGIYNWGMWDYGNSGRLNFSKNWEITKAGKVFEDLVYNKWWTREEGKTDANGVYKTRGYFGDYDIKVTANGQTKAVTAKLYKDSDKNIVITMD